MILPVLSEVERPVLSNAEGSEDFETKRELFLESLRVRHCAAETVRHYRDALNGFFRYLLREGMSELRDVNEETARAYHLSLVNGGRLKVTSIAGYLTYVFKFFRWLEENNFILVNPCARLQVPKQPKRLPRPVLKPSEVQAILNYPDLKTKQGVRDRAILELFYSSGLRVAEMASLRLHHLDLKNGFVRVDHGKGGRSRVVPVGAKACDMLNRYLREARLAWIKASRGGMIHDHLWLSPIQPHQPLKKETITGIVGRIARRASINRSAPPHLWRHTFATHLMNRGSNLAIVQKLLGHRSINTTEIYTRVTVPDIKQMVQKAHPRSRGTFVDLISSRLKSPFKGETPGKGH